MSVGEFSGPWWRGRGLAGRQGGAGVPCAQNRQHTAGGGRQFRTGPQSRRLLAPSPLPWKGCAGRGGVPPPRTPVSTPSWVTLYSQKPAAVARGHHGDCGGSEAVPALGGVSHHRGSHRGVHTRPGTHGLPSQCHHVQREGHPDDCPSLSYLLRPQGRCGGRGTVTGQQRQS